MPKYDFETGTSTIEQYFAFINERHRIYCRRARGELKPWTDDKILQSFKFTNIFRQLDRGTVALRRLLSFVESDADFLAWTIIWYRLLNLDVHANHFSDLGHAPKNPEELEGYLRHSWRMGHKIFTSAHMTSGRAGEDKIDTYLGIIHDAWYRRTTIAAQCSSTKSMEQVFIYLKENLDCVGNFIAYEMVCDFRFTPLLYNATDINTWANVGPGAARGLQRLGVEPELEPMLSLLDDSKKYLSKEVKSCEWPWELREIEHCLCEFDKYERARLGQGRPRQKFQGV